jgi:ribosome biogenesis protein NSA2
MRQIFGFLTRLLERVHRRTHQTPWKTLRLLRTEVSGLTFFNGFEYLVNFLRRKKEARAVHKSSAIAQKAFGLKAKILHAKRHAEKVQLKKTLKAHDERNVKQADPSAVPDSALPAYLLDREGQKDAKALSTAIKQKRKDKAAKYAVPLPKVRGIAEDEMFKVLKTGKSKSKSWKRMVTKATFVGEGFTRKPVKMERFVRPMALRYKKANVTHRMPLLFPPEVYQMLR